MQINRPGQLQHAPQLHQARSHHREIRHHVAVAEESAEGLHGVGHAPAAFDDFLIRMLGVEVPLPGVLECHDLRAGARAIAFREENVIVLAAIEGRIEVNQIHRFVLDVAPQDVQVVAVVELILGIHFGVILQEQRVAKNWRGRSGFYVARTLLSARGALPQGLKPKMFLRAWARR